MKFLLLSGSGDGLALALRLKQEDNDVAAWIREGRAKQNYDGLIRKVKKFEEFLDKNTVVIFDSSGGGRTADRLRAQGHAVLGGSTFADQLEIDRGVAMGIMEEAGIKLPHSETFTNWDRAKAYVKERDTRLAFKPSGEMAAGMASYVGADAEDLLEMLDVFADIHKGKPEFELQDFIKGLAVSSEGWFNGREFMMPWNHTLERKSVMNDDLGGSMGCSGNVVWCVQEATPVIEKGIALMAPVLAHYGYLGPIDLNTIVNEDGVWALEFTPRFGYDAWPALLELWNGKAGDVIASIARGEHPKTLPTGLLSFGTALRMTIPPAPSEHFRPEPGQPVRGFTRADRSHLFFYDIMLNEKGKLVNSPGYSSIAAITGRGDSIEEAFAGPYEIAERAKVPNKQYRTDMKSVMLKDYLEFQRLTTPALEPEEATHVSE